MTNEEKQLLLKDLCSRLSYGVKFCFTNSNIHTIKGLDLIVSDEGDWEYAVTAKGIEPIELIYIKPYLSPMSSMTEDEQRTLDSMCNGVEMVSRLSGLKMFDKAFDWLNAHHFDYRGLIEKGLALEAPEGMYKEV